MFACMKQAVLLQRVHTQNPTESNGEEAIEMATRVGATYMGIDAGVLAPGKLADLVVVDQVGSPPCRPSTGPWRRWSTRPAPPM